MIRVLLADDHSIVRDGLRRIVEESGDMTVVAEAADGREAIARARTQRPDVAVIDISMPGLDGLEVISHLLSLYADLPILVLTMHEEEQYLVRAFEAGAMGYLTKRSAPEQLVSAIRKVYAGSRYLTAEAAEILALRLARGTKGGSPPGHALHPGTASAPAPCPWRHEPGDRRRIRDQHQNRRHLPFSNPEKAQSSEQRRAFPLCHATPPH